MTKDRPDWESNPDGERRPAPMMAPCGVAGCSHPSFRRCDRCRRSFCSAHRFTEGCAAWMGHGRHEAATPPAEPLPDSGMECALCGWTTDRGYMMGLHVLGCAQEREELRLYTLEPLAVLMEAELILMAHWAGLRGCGCARHRPWTATS